MTLTVPTVRRLSLREGPWFVASDVRFTATALRHRRRPCRRTDQTEHPGSLGPGRVATHKSAQGTAEPSEPLWSGSRRLRGLGTRTCRLLRGAGGALGEGWPWWQGRGFLKAGGQAARPRGLSLETGQLSAWLKARGHWPGCRAGGRPAGTQRGPPGAGEAGAGGHRSEK